jgi:hypothetical protein
MAWYTEDNKIHKVNSDNDWWKHWYGPSQTVPVSGIYKCMNCKKEVTSNKGDPFPPQNHHQHQTSSPIQWELIVRTNTDGV